MEGEDDLNAYWEVFDSVFGKEAADTLVRLIEKAQEFSRKVGYAVENVKTHITNFWAAVQPKLQEFQTWLATDGVDALQTFYTKAGEFDVVQSEFLVLLKEMGETYRLVFQDMENETETTMPSLAEIIGTAMDKIKTSTLEKMTFLRDTFKLINNAIKGDWHQVFAVNLPNVLEDTFVLLLNSVGMNGQQMLFLWQKTTSDIVDTALNLRGSLHDAFVYVFQDLPGLFNQAAYNMMMGLVNGFYANQYAVQQALADIVQQAIDNILNFLGISSPSKLMAGVGEMMAAGLVQGFDKPQLNFAPTVLQHTLGANRTTLPGPIFNQSRINHNTNTATNVEVVFNGVGGPVSQSDAEVKADWMLNALRAKGVDL